ncbi:type 4b pilus protein PilO2 [Acidithiobacillus acidisediminis]|uniref:type 4b pilus protein PilO2 n=1 Tax=Acidithiobacillus acidisediminis TaxID=2937799 RepID=UPI00200F20CB|nr:type 4b pilus protein PilO2 [Acidithiobacillus sp. S30A2]
MPGLIKIPGDKRVFVAGMYWRHEDRKPSRKTLLAGARGTDFWVAQRRTKSRSLQSGFSRPLTGADFLTEGGKKAALNKVYRGTAYSLAAAMADVLQEPWLGIFDLGNGLYWYIAVRDSYEILPDGDAVGDWEAVDNLRRQHAAYGEPSVFRDGGLEEIAEILRQGPKITPVVDVRKNPAMPAILGGGALAAAAAGGLVFWHIHEEQVEKSQLLAQEQRIAIERAMAARRAANRVLPWAAQPFPSAFLRDCMGFAQGIPLSDKGWGLKSIACRVSNGQVLAQETWSWSPGATALYRPKGQLLERGKTVLQTLRVGSIAASGDGQTLPVQRAEETAYGVAQALALDIRLSAPVAPVQKTLPGERPAPKPAKSEKPWETMNVVLKGPLAQWGNQSLWDIPGLRFTQLLFTPSKTGAITLKAIGDLYSPNAAFSAPRSAIAVRSPKNDVPRVPGTDVVSSGGMQ